MTIPVNADCWLNKYIGELAGFFKEDTEVSSTFSEFAPNKITLYNNGETVGELFFFPKNGGRLEISGMYPRGMAGRFETHSITVTTKKLPEAVYNDITRRLLPGYLPDYEGAVAAKKRDDDAEAAKLKTIDELIEKYPGIFSNNPYRDGVYAKGLSFREVRVNHDGSEINLNLTYLSKGLALKIIDLVAEEGINA